VYDQPHDGRRSRAVRAEIRPSAAGPLESPEMSLKLLLDRVDRAVVLGGAEFEVLRCLLWFGDAAASVFSKVALTDPKHGLLLVGEGVRELPDRLAVRSHARNVFGPGFGDDPNRAAGACPLECS